MPTPVKRRKAVRLQSGPLQAPFPYFGGKSIVVDMVWSRLGDVPNYVEPFFGSGAMLLRRPHVIKAQCETVNDLDGLVANFWRAVQHDPQAVAKHADWPVNENDLHARHAWLVGHKDSLQARLEGDPDFFDAKVAGWWCWGTCCWIGSGFCSGDGPWHVVDGELVNTGNKGQGVNRQRVHLGDKGRGVNRKRIHLGNKGQGVNRKRVDLANDGIGVTRLSGGIYDWMERLSDRLRHVRVCCGDWSRVCGEMSTVKHGLTGVFLDPPYGDKAGRTADLYRQDSLDIAADVERWCREWQNDPRMRIALCGYEGEYDLPGWECRAWKASGGYCSQDSQGSVNCEKERIWFSPQCLAASKIYWGLFSVQRGK